ncbi:hypothetical protein SAMN04490248_11614 [Salinihabitans flavidus]|uniref:Glycine transporter domain-containing protein n=1 Tax=Salinihabitans flavidus TaxID=569882 RepID=A0A1H8TLN5_9RHOB|nr:TRIC cation channel family protein [Salinihabitans flavidus]SEO91755.1 hypothetical protein SAMN04490248_11614 [Salinihabitans flavidus]
MEILPLGLWLDLFGMFIIGLSGAILAVRRNLDVFVIAVPRARQPCSVV